jgi:hypothetical protein
LTDEARGVAAFLAAAGDFAPGEAGPLGRRAGVAFFADELTAGFAVAFFAPGEAAADGAPIFFLSELGAEEGTAARAGEAPAAEAEARAVDGRAMGFFTDALFGAAVGVAAFVAERATGGFFAEAARTGVVALAAGFAEAARTGVADLAAGLEGFGLAAVFDAAVEGRPGSFALRLPLAGRAEEEGTAAFVPA